MMDTVRSHYDVLVALYLATDDPDLAADIYAELAEFDREAAQDTGLFEAIYGAEED
jgi:hypothetical protein